VRNTAQLAARAAVGPAAALHEPLRAIGETSEHMLRVVNHVLDTYAVERGRLHAACAPGNAAAVLTGCVARHRPSAAQKEQTLELVDTDEAIAAVFDPTLLGQVLDNLLSNALKFSPPRATIRVGVRATPAAAGATAPRVRWWVQDAGPGLSAADRENLFQSYARLSARPTGGEPSSGFGLAAAQRLTLAMQGEIGADSAPAGGTIFWVALPAA